MNTIFSPSLMSIDRLNIKEQILTMNDYVQMYHIDIMDGHFAKNIALSPAFIKAIRPLTNLPLDAHLMAYNPTDFLIEAVIDAGADIISLHSETINTNAFRTLRQIKQKGKKFGIVLCPATPINAIEPYMDEIDMLTLMGVDIGYAGQKFIPQTIQKIKQAYKLRNDKKLDFDIQVDGGVNKTLYKELTDCGVNVFVMGASALFLNDIPFEDSCKRMVREYTEATSLKI